MPEGTLGILYDPQNTEDVKIYSATVPYNGNGTVVSACPCSDYDATVDVCSAYHTFDDDGWITVHTKKKKEGDPLGNKGMSQGHRMVHQYDPPTGGSHSQLTNLNCST
jgi:hypothetical protein